MVSSVGKIEENSYVVMSKYHINTQDVKLINNDEKDYEVFDELPFWFDGSGIVNKKRNRLYVYNNSTGNVEPITDEYSFVLQFKAKENKVLYIANRYTDKQEQYNGLYLYDISTRKTTMLVEPKYYDIKFVNFYKDTVVFSALDLREYGINGDSDFYIIENGSLKLLYKMPYNMFSTVNSDCRQGTNEPIKIFNDEIYFCPTTFTNSYLQKINKNGELETIISDDGSVDGFDVDENRILYIAMKENKLQEIYEYTIDAETQITEFNKCYLENKKISTPEKLEVKNDNLKIQGFVIKPADFDVNKKYPAILNIHGGPKSIYGSVHHHEMQLLANEEYFVFFCNQRGSDGRGREFADIRGKYGTVDYDDLMKFTDGVLEKYPQIDENRLGVSGGSYGGFMTNWIIGHTDRFKCAVSQRGIANWISKFLTTDKGYNYNADQQASTPWENTEKIWWHSPIKYADRVKTSTLFIQSEQDYRCYMTEAIQMFTALKYHGIESRLCLFNGESHGLSTSGKPKHRARRLEEILNWFNHYLK